MEKSQVSLVLKSLVRYLGDRLPIKKIIGAICDKEKIPVLILTPPPKNIPADVLYKLVDAFNGEYLPVFAKEKDTLVIRYLPPAEVKQCEKISEKDTPYPNELLVKDSPECFEIYKEVVLEKQPAILFFKKEGCKYCEDLEYFLYKEGAGLSDEELQMLETVVAKLGLIYVDGDKCPTLKKIMGVKVFPSLVLIWDGKPVLKVERFSLSVEADKKKIQDFIRAVYNYLLEK